MSKPETSSAPSSKRKDPLQVLALGISRTGTESLSKALNILGYRCYHGFTTIESHQQCLDWVEAIQAKYENKGKLWEGAADFDRILGGYTACTDFPCAWFATELIEAYPDARIILNKRPMEDWYRSYINVIVPQLAPKSWLTQIRLRLDNHVFAFRRCWESGYNHYYRGNVARNAKQVYREHNALIRGAVRPGRPFLEYSASQGWEPLCKFLDKPIPNEKFPTGNSPSEFLKTISDFAQPKVARAEKRIKMRMLVLMAMGIFVFVGRRIFLWGTT